MDKRVFHLLLGPGISFILFFLVSSASTHPTGPSVIHTDSPEGVKLVQRGGLTGGLTPKVAAVNDPSDPLMQSTVTQEGQTFFFFFLTIFPKASM